MLERIREGAQGPWAMVIIALIVLSFVFAGVGGYLGSPAPTAVATVNGEEISASEFDRAYQNQRAQMEAQFGEGIAALFSDPGYLQQFRSDVLDRLVGEMLLKQHANELGLRVGDDQVRDAIVSMPEFQIAGQFNNDRYLAIIRQAGFLQAADFRDYLRREITRDQLQRAISASAFSLPEQAKDIALLEQQTRDAKVVTIDADLFATDVAVSDQELQVYYDGNLSLFDTEEQVDIAYVAVNVADLEKDVTVDDAQALEYYEQNIRGFQTDEERRVSHILVEFGDDKGAALAQIEALKSRLDAGEDFAELARSESADTFSAETGGDLGFITADMMGEAFDNAAFALAEAGQVSDVVETEFGFHLIKATEIKAQQTSPFEDVKEEIITELVREEALTRFFDIQSQMAQIAFEVPESLDEVAGVANAEIQTTGLITRNSAPSPLNSAAVLTQAFSVELIEDQVNSDVIEIDDETAVVIRVIDHKPQSTKPLEEVKEQITVTLTAQKAQDAAQTWANSVKAAIQNDGDATSLLTEKSLEWREITAVGRSSADLTPDLSDALFSLAPEENNIDVVAMNNGDVGIIQVVKVNQPTLVEENLLSQFRQRLTVMNSQSTMNSVIESLKAEAEIVVLQQ